MARPDRYKRYGSIRILVDGRVRFSAWTFPALSYISFKVGGLISVESSGRRVMELDVSRGRIVSANFPYDLTPDELTEIVSDLRRAGNGIERWIVPALEFTCLASTFREDNPKTYASARKLLKSCRDLPIAQRWQQVRANVIARHIQADTAALRKSEAAPLLLMADTWLTPPFAASRAALPLRACPMPFRPCPGAPIRRPAPLSHLRFIGWHGRC